jgi:hypothetical protein
MANRLFFLRAPRLCPDTFSSVSPAEEYAARLKDREARVERHYKRHLALGNIRLLLAAITATLAWLVWGRHLFSAWWIFLPVVAFVAVAAYHSKVLQAKAFAERAAAVYRRGLARMEDRWAGAGQSGERFNDAHHVYAADLDLFGHASLFQLLSTARTRMGEERLASWLRSPSSLEQILRRQAAVSELRDELDLREDIAVLGEDAEAGVHPEALVQWANAPNQMHRPWIRIVAPILALLAIAGALGWYLSNMAWPFLFVLLIEGLITYSFRHQLDAVLHGAEHAFEDIELLSDLLSRVEREKFESARLRELLQDVSSHHTPASQAIARLRTLVDLIASRQNAVMRVLDLPLLYSVQVAFAAEAWRRKHGMAVRRWINALGELEALLSIAAYSYEHLGDPFPEFVDGKAQIMAEDLGHPLIASHKCVRNDVSIQAETRVLLVSGSNMSGKSTLLRSIGVNVVLAMAGAPVRARALRMTPLQIGASIRVNDSLQEGSSRFYAEIKRLRQIVDLAGKHPSLLFLLDELLQGTNSSDRRVGAEALLRVLVERGSIGLVSTHDLALADVSAPLDTHVRNVHLQDDFEHGRMRFDYKLREGVVTKSNGLELMRSIGLDV